MSETTTPVVTKTKHERAKQIAKGKAKPDLQVNRGKRAKIDAPPAADAPTKGRGKLIDTLSPTELQQEIKDFLTDLRDSKDPEEKKRIRRALRLRGHRGGLNDKPAAAAK